MNGYASPTIDTFDDLLFVVNNRPEWRQQLVAALFPHLDIEATLGRIDETNRLLRRDIALFEKRMDKFDKELVQVNKRLGNLDDKFDNLDSKVDNLEDKVDNLTDRVGGLENSVDNLTGRVGNLEDKFDNLTDQVGDLQDSVGTLKGDNYEGQISTRLNAILGPVLRRGRDARHEINEQLDDAEDAGIISKLENSHVNLADLLWQGISKESKEQICIVGEASWLAELNDVERAVQRAKTIRQAGLAALPLVAGQKWTYEALEAAKEQGVVCVRNFSLEGDSWDTALESMKENLQ